MFLFGAGDSDLPSPEQRRMLMSRESLAVGHVKRGTLFGFAPPPLPALTFWEEKYAPPMAA